MNTLVAEPTSSIGLRDDRSLTSRPYQNRQMIIVAADTVVKAAQLLQKATAAVALEEEAAIGRPAADKKADKIIHQTVLQIVAAALVPAAFNWMIQNALSVVGMARIARVYGVSLSKAEAGKLLTQFMMATGAWFVVAQFGSKALASAIEATGAGYAGGVAIDMPVSAATGYAVCFAAKAFFRGEPVTEIGKVVQAAFKRARKEFTPAKLVALRQEAKASLVDYEGLHRILQSPIGREIADASLRANPVVAREITRFTSSHRLGRLDELSPEQLKMMNEENGSAQELWDILGDRVDMPLLMEVSKAPAVDPAAVRDLCRSLGRLREQGVEIVSVMHSEASALNFPLGHPRNRVVYVRHPAIPTAYYTAAHFHRLTFEHKFAEAIRLLQHLGANSIEVMHETGWSREFAGKLSVPLDVLTQIGGEINGTNKSQSFILFKGTYPGSNNPSLPADLVWYPHEPTWQQIVEGRQKHGMKAFSLDVRYEDDFGLNASVAAKIQALDIGFELGAAFEEHQSTAWRIVGRFGELT